MDAGKGLRGFGCQCICWKMVELQQSGKLDATQGVGNVLVSVRPSEAICRHEDSRAQVIATDSCERESACAFGGLLKCEE